MGLAGAGISIPCWLKKAACVTDSCSFCTQSGNPYAVWHIRRNVNDVIIAQNTFREFCYVVNSFLQKNVTHVVFSITESTLFSYILCIYLNNVS